MIKGLHHNAYRCRDPNGYVIELTSPTSLHAREMDPTKNEARVKLDRWQAAKANITVAG